jgi:putative peptidoglycan lipid II flippase
MTHPPRRGLVKTTLVLMPVHIVFRAGEGLLPFLLAYWFGRNHATDVYNFAWAVFMFAGSLVFSAYHDSALVPILAEARLRDPGSLRKIAGSVLAHTWLFGGALAFIVAAVAFGWFGIRYDGDEFALAAKMVPAFGLQLVALSTKTFFAAMLNAHHTFMPYPVASATSVVVTIAFVAVTGSHIGILSVPIGSLLGEIVAASMLGGVVIRYLGVVPKLTFERPAAVKRFASLVVSEVGGGAVTRINPVVDQLMAGIAGVSGGATLLRYSNDVASMPTSLLQATFLSVLLAHLAEAFAKRDLAHVRATVTRAVFIVLGLLTASAALLFASRSWLLQLLFLHGQMDQAGVERMINIFPYHLAGLGSFGVLLVLARANVALQNSRIMLGMGVLNASMNVLFNTVFLKVLGLEGIALSTSMVHSVIAVVFWFRFQRRLRELSESQLAEPA